jgi:hypothetical protein
VRNQPTMLMAIVLAGIEVLGVPGLYAQSAGVSFEQPHHGSTSGKTSSLANRIGGEPQETISRSRFQMRDPVWNGAAIGGGIALGVGIAHCLRASEGGETCDDRVEALIALAAIGAAIGAGIDALFNRRPFHQRRPAAATFAVGPARSRSSVRTVLGVRGSVCW